MRIWKTKKQQVAFLVRQRNEGFRLMRQGDGYDEFYGIRTYNEAVEELKALGYDERGNKIKKNWRPW